MVEYRPPAEGIEAAQPDPAQPEGIEAAQPDPAPALQVNSSAVAKAAIVYLGSLGDEVTADSALGIARRVERALDRRDHNAAAAYKTVVAEVDYGDGRVARTGTISRHVGSEGVAVVDIYQLDYRTALRRRFVAHNAVVRVGFVLLALFWGVTRLVPGVRRAGKGITGKEQVQLAYALLVVSTLLVYLLILMAALIGSVRTLIEPQAQGTTTAPTPTVAEAPPATAAPALTAPTPEDQLARNAWQFAVEIGIGLWWWIRHAWAFVTLPFRGFWGLLDPLLSQAYVVLLVVLSLLIPRFNERREAITNAAIDLITVRDYLQIGARREAILGQVHDLLEYVLERPASDDSVEPSYRSVHLIGYSFGSVIALDALFPFGSDPRPRLQRVETLTTIGCPYDVVRTYWPHYFQARHHHNEVPQAWYNVYSPLDVLSSNFCNDTARICDVPNAPLKVRTNAQPTPTCRRPTTNVAFAHGGRDDFRWGDIIPLMGLRAHSMYWEAHFESEYSAFDEVIGRLVEERRLPLAPGPTGGPTPDGA